MEYKEVINIEIWWNNKYEVIFKTKSPYENVKSLITEEMKKITTLEEMINNMDKLTEKISSYGYGTNFVYKGYTKGLERR